MFIIIPLTIAHKCPHCRAVIDRSTIVGWCLGTRLASPIQKCRSCGRDYRDLRFKEWTHRSKSEQLSFKSSKIVEACIHALLPPIAVGILWVVSNWGTRDLTPVARVAYAYPLLAGLLIFRARKETQRQIALSIKRTSPPPLPVTLAIPHSERNRLAATPPALPPALCR